MNNIKSTFAILAVAAVLAMGVCSITYESEATETSIGTVTYSSIDGFDIHLDDVESGQVGVNFPNDGVSAGGMLVDHNLHVDIADVTGRLTEGTGYQGQLMVRPLLPVSFTMDIAEMIFNVNGGIGSTVTAYMSTGVNNLPELGFTGPNGEEFLGWATTADATVPDVDDGYEVPTDGDTLYAVYGTAPVTTEVTITVTGNGAVVTAEGLVNGKITAEVGTQLTFTVNAQTGYILDGAKYTYNGETKDITEGSFTITVAEGADTLVVDAEKEQPVEPVTVTVRSTGAQITYDGETVAGSVQLMPGSEATFGISALEGYTMEGCSVTYGGQPVAVDNGQFTITVSDEGGVIEIVLQQVGPGPGPEPEVYDVTVISNDGAMGTASAEPASAEEGTTVTLSYIANDGYRFVEWISDDVEIIGDRFVMPAKNVTVTAVFEAIPPTEYTIIVNQATGGTATASAATAIEGAVITLTATPDDGYVLDHWVINSDDVYRNTFTMPAGNVTVTPVFRALDNYDVTIEISGEGTVLNGGSEVMDGTMITVRELSDLVLTYTAGEDNYTVRCTVSDENARVSNASGTLTVSGISTDCTVTIEFVQGYMVSVNGGDHGEVSPGTGLQAENATVTYTVRPDAGYAVNRVLVDGQEVVVTGNQFQVDVGSSTHSIIVEYVFVGIVDDDDEEYVPPVVVVPKGDDDTTTYIVAIAAAAVVAVLAAIILMQSRKS